MGLGTPTLPVLLLGVTSAAADAERQSGPRRVGGDALPTSAPAPSLSVRQSDPRIDPHDSWSWFLRREQTGRVIGSVRQGRLLAGDRESALVMYAAATGLRV
jgi:hypothetical protein